MAGRQQGEDQDMVDGQQGDGGERTGRGPVTVGRRLGVVKETVGRRQEELGVLCCSLIVD